ncbi:unnamed protein product [Adineta steineri]|uniref:Enoyl reductase (ER) domain-containing protein n=1 Tax=Adineta steineri TaxID=433720 RepID=A0A813VW70_9BILA|nr:unnamed protein product [Adineta steineri]CAF3679412.1 unnamed protein product [Adineta steineri]
MAESNSNSTSGIPSVMKAAQQNGYGDARNVLTLRDDVPVPRELSSKQILVRVHAASINPVDWKVLNGNMSLITRFSFPHIPGKDVAGVIVDVGSGVKRFQVGDKVYGNLGMSDGSFAEYARADESAFAIKPNNLTMEEAAAIPLACETSYQALFTKISPPIGEGSKVLICGGSTATGLYAVQLAKAVGAYVTTTCSQRNFGLLEKLGYKTSQTTADQNQVHIIDYNEKDFGKELKGQNYDVVYDCVGGQQQWTSAQEVLKRNGQFITIVGDDTKSVLSVKAIASVGSSIVNRKFWSVFGSLHHNYIMHFLIPNFQNLNDMRTKYIETGKVKPIIDTVFDWRKDGVESLYSLYEKSKSGKAQGKLILKIADEE